MGEAVYYLQRNGIHENAGEVLAPVMEDGMQVTMHSNIELQKMLIERMCEVAPGRVSKCYAVMKESILYPASGECQHRSMHAILVLT